MSVRIIIGGPPNSGKSTLAESLARALQDQGIDAEAVDLDLWAPTLELLQGKITEEKRDKKKRMKITKKEAIEAAQRFKKKSKEHDVVIGDAPGGISDESKQIYKAASHAILVCRDDKIDECDMWKEFFKKIGVKLIVVITSKMQGEEEVHSNDLINAVFVNLDRNPTVTAGIRQFATLLRDKLGI